MAKRKFREIICNGCGTTFVEWSPHRQYCTEDCKRRKNSSRRERTNWRFHLKRFYGMSPEDFDKLILEQLGLCKICGQQLEGKRGLFIDHLHVEEYDNYSDEGKKNCVRGLLCGSCNRGLGHFNDDSTLFRNAARYVETSFPLREET